MNSAVKNIIFWVVMVVTALLIWAVVRSSTSESVSTYTFTQFVNQVDGGNVQQVTIAGTNVTGVLKKDNAKFKTVIPANYPDLYKDLISKDVRVTMKSESGSTWVTWLANGLPLILLIGLWIFFMRQMQSGGNKALSFGKSRARLLSTQHKKITFKDVAGVQEAKDELTEIIDFLREPQKFQKLGGRIPKGVLLVGPPGTGKTLLARAIAGEANVPFFSISGSDFVEMFVGVGASRVRDLFEQGKKNAPCIIFIDEIDAVGRHRGAGLGGGHDEREQTLNQLLVEMDGFESNEGVILIAATNRPDVLDPALLRPGRFDRRVIVPRPDVKGREAILKVHTKKVPLSEDVDLPVLARGTPGFSGADLANLVNEGALLAARQNRKQVSMLDLETAKDKVLMGPERRSMILSDDEKRNTAYHEAGHALVASMLPNADPLHKVTIIPRGMALGVTMQLPLDDKHTYTRDFLEAQLAIMMGGRVAEDMVFGKDKVTSGAASDIEQATKLARMMVTRWGLSDELGAVAYGDNQDEVFLGYQVARQHNISEETSRKIDAEVRKLVEAGLAEARQILTDKRADLETLARGLIEFETLTGDEIKDLLNGKRPVRESVIEPATPRSSAVPPAGKPRPRPEPPTGDVAPQPQG